jgi:murein DD-endopeptidase MepM/ murein hydrolase activator NlpD
LFFMLHLIHPALSRAAALEPRRLRHDALVAAAVAVALALAVNSTVSATLATAAENAAAQPQAQQFAAASVTAPPTVRDDYTVDVRPPLMYPVGAGAPIGSSFGLRPSTCAGCPSVHKGVDWTPGYGAPVVAMADGVVSLIGNPGSALGTHLEISHVIDGRSVTSVYAHLVAGSIPWALGDRVRVGDLVGNVGTTGVTVGAHLHFELRVDGVTIDPVPWLRANGAQ